MTDGLQEKLLALQAQLRALGSVAVAFSAGVDSTFLLRAAHDVLGGRAVAVTARSVFCPRQETDEAAAFCRENGIRQLVLDFDPLAVEGVAQNPPDRCYRCKRALFTGIRAAAEEMGLACVTEGSNLDDMGDYRPGMRAVAELGIKSPLRDAGLTKADIRALSKQMGLPTWDKPSYACLASRFVYGERLTPERLATVDQAERHLRALGFTQVRVRVHGNLARIEVPAQDLVRLAEQGPALDERLRALGFAYVSMDLGGFKTGSMNRTLGK